MGIFLLGLICGLIIDKATYSDENGYCPINNWVKVPPTNSSKPSPPPKQPAKKVIN